VYGEGNDITCWDNCHSTCAANLGGSSSLCLCAGHGKCLFGCPENCEDSIESTCNEDCLAKGGYDVKACNTKCNQCADTLGCWEDATAYGDAADITCHNNCYSLCDDYWATTSSLCDCSLGNCIFGCPGNCEASNLISCNVDCVGESSDALGCATLCDACVTTKQCWTDTTYGAAADVTCFDDCYTGCATNFGSESDLCDCADHTACVLGCPENCDDGTLKTCNIDCLATNAG
jgi:hypothetical protein